MRCLFVLAGVLAVAVFVIPETVVAQKKRVLRSARRNVAKIQELGISGNVVSSDAGKGIRVNRVDRDGTARDLGITAGSFIWLIKVEYANGNGKNGQQQIPVLPRKKPQPPADDNTNGGNLPPPWSGIRKTPTRKRPAPNDDNNRGDGRRAPSRRRRANDDNQRQNNGNGTNDQSPTVTVRANNIAAVRRALRDNGISSITVVWRQRGKWRINSVSFDSDPPDDGQSNGNDKGG
jgi:hypothetical protein